MTDKALLALLRQALEPPVKGDAGKTVTEIALEVFGKATTSTRAMVWTRLGPEVDAGNVVVGRGARKNRGGVWHGEPVYRVVSKK